jgi:hypothetical protein
MVESEGVVMSLFKDSENSQVYLRPVRLWRTRAPVPFVRREHMRLG